MLSRENKSTADNLTGALLLIYLGALLWIVLLKLGVHFSYMTERKVNLVPFSAPLRFNGQIDYGEMILNVLIFIPLGVYAGMLFKQLTFFKNIFMCFLVSLACEGLQFILIVGAFDITDIINNTLGGMIGFLMFKSIESMLKNSAKAQKVVNIVALIGTVVMVSFLLLLKMDMLPIRYQ